MTQQRRTLLVDSSGVLHRCFHGYPPRIGDVGGEMIDCAALYGYLHYTCRLMEEFECERMVHVLDHESGSRFRFDLYPEYKANRSPTDEKLTRQKQLLPQLLEAVGHTHVSVEGVEADDIIATLARKAKEAGDVVLIISQDKDLLQLVEDGCVNVARYVQSSDKMGKLHDFFDEANVRRVLGVHPNQVADYLAIVGDSTDNIPGVTDAGPKTAASWLQEHGNLATLMTNADKVKGRGSKGLRADMDKLLLYQKLTTALYDVDVDFPEPCERDEELCRSALSILNAPADWLGRFGFDNQQGFTTRGPRM